EPNSPPPSSLPSAVPLTTMTSLHFLHRILKTLPWTLSSAMEYFAPQLSQTIFIGEPLLRVASNTPLYQAAGVDSTCSVTVALDRHLSLATLAASSLANPPFLPALRARKIQTPHPGVRS